MEMYMFYKYHYIFGILMSSDDPKETSNQNPQENLPEELEPTRQPGESEQAFELRRAIFRR